MAEYASNAKGNAALTTGIIGTSLGAIAAAGGLGGILGFGSRPDPGDRPVTRYEMELHQQINARDNEITALRANSYTDRRAAELQREIDGQGAVNAAVTATLQNQQGQINQLLGMTKTVVPNESVSPGWGRANVQPAPPCPPYFMPWFPAFPGMPPFQAPPANSASASTPSTSNATAGG